MCLDNVQVRKTRPAFTCALHDQNQSLNTLNTLFVNLILLGFFNTTLGTRPNLKAARKSRPSQEFEMSDGKFVIKEDNAVEVTEKKLDIGEKDMLAGKFI